MFTQVEKSVNALIKKNNNLANVFIHTNKDMYIYELIFYFISCPAEPMSFI